MSPAAFVGVIEWPDSEPDVILAATAHGVRVAALNFFLTRGQDGTFHLAFDYGADLTSFVAVCPPPRDHTDVSAVKEWHMALREATSQPILTIFGAQSDPAERIYAWTLNSQ